MNELSFGGLLIGIALTAALSCCWTGCGAAPESAGPSPQAQTEPEQKEEALIVEDISVRVWEKERLIYLIEAQEASSRMAQNQYSLREVEVNFFNEQGELDAVLKAVRGVQYLEATTITLNILGEESRIVSRLAKDVDMFGDEQRPVQWRKADGSFVEGSHIYYNYAADDFSTSAPIKSLMMIDADSFFATEFDGGFWADRKQTGLRGYGLSRTLLQGATNQATSDTLRVTSNTLSVTSDTLSGDWPTSRSLSVTSDTLRSDRTSSSSIQALAARAAGLNRKKKFPE